jgi:hypothetical protein
MHQAAIKILGLVGDELKQKSSRKKSIHQEYTGIRTEDPNLRQAKEPIRLSRQTMRHEGRTHGISSRRPG